MTKLASWIFSERINKLILTEVEYFKDEICTRLRICSNGVCAKKLLKKFNDYTPISQCFHTLHKCYWSNWTHPDSASANVYCKLPKSQKFLPGALTSHVTFTCSPFDCIFTYCGECVTTASHLALVNIEVNVIQRIESRERQMSVRSTPENGIKH